MTSPVPVTSAFGFPSAWLTLPAPLLFASMTPARHIETLSLIQPVLLRLLWERDTKISHVPGDPCFAYDLVSDSGGPGNIST